MTGAHKPPKPPGIVRRSAPARRAWRDLWKLLDTHEMGHDVYAPIVAVMAVELGIADEASNAIYRPIDQETGKRGKRTLEQYLDGRNSQTAQELTVLRDSLRQLAKLAGEFGTSPLSQKRVGVPAEKDEESPMMQYIRAANERLKRRVS